jgi:hypothetical protein
VSAKKEFGRFINTSPIHCEWTGQSSWGCFWKVDKWEYFAHPDKPLTFITPTGVEIQPDKHFHTDFGSIPPPLMAFPSLSRTRFFHSYLFHDSGYRHKGLWVRDSSLVPFAFKKMTRLELDEWLWIWIGSQGGNLVQRSMIYSAVRVGGG